MVNETTQLWEDAAEGVSGLQEWIGTVQDAYFDLTSNIFNSASQYGDSVALVLSTSIDQAIDPPDFKFDDARIILTVGKADNWNILDAGQAIRPVKGGMGNSKYQQFIKRVTKELGVPMAQRTDATGSPVSPYEARVWNGLSFHFKRESEPIPERLRKEGGRDSTWITLPIRWMQDKLPPLV